MFGHVDDDGAARFGVDLGGVRVLSVQNVSGELDDGALQAQADAEERLVVGSSPVCRSYFAFDAASSETSGNKNTCEEYDYY